MSVGEGVIQRHILEVGLDVSVEELLNHGEVKVGVHKNGGKICLEHVRKTL